MPSLVRVNDVVDGEKVRAANSADATYAKTPDGRTWVRKREIELGANGMLAEAVGYLLGNALGANVPEACVASPDSDDERSWLSLTIPNVSHWTAEAAPAIVNLDVIAAALTLDVIIINEDRHGGNILIEDSSGSLVAWTIDTGNAYVGVPIDIAKRPTDLPSSHQLPRSLPLSLLKPAALSAAMRAASMSAGQVALLAADACAAVNSSDVDMLSYGLYQRTSNAVPLVSEFFRRLGHP